MSAKTRRDLFGVYCEHCGYTMGKHRASDAHCPISAGSFHDSRSFKAVPKPPGNKTLQETADFMKEIADWIEEDSEDWSRGDVLAQADRLRMLASIVRSEGA